MRDGDLFRVTCGRKRSARAGGHPVARSIVVEPATAAATATAGAAASALSA